MAAQMPVQQKARNDTGVLEEKIRRSTREESASKTISQEMEEEAAMPLFPS